MDRHRHRAGPLAGGVPLLLHAAWRRGVRPPRRARAHLARVGRVGGQRLAPATPTPAGGWAAAVLKVSRSLEACRRRAHTLRSRGAPPPPPAAAAAAASLLAEEEEGAALCYECGVARENDEATLLLCDARARRPRGAHVACLGLPGVPAGDWFCDACPGEGAGAGEGEEEGEEEEEESEGGDEAASIRGGHF